tara:strand:- start:1055 stop:1711 length:657 start_codon:yes stop_codon:yes gene_type:complete
MKIVRKKSHEKLDDVNIQRVLDYLRQDKPITKKEACAMLNISYNTTRLNSIIADFEETLEFRAKRKSQNRGRKATNHEIKQSIEMYLDEQPVSSIASALYRSSTFVRNLLDRVGVPQKRPKTLQGMSEKIGYLPDECVSESFEQGEKVWCARYDLPARIIKGAYDSRYDCIVYHIYVIELTNFESKYFGHIQEGGFHAHFASYDLGSLRHLNKYDINI